MTDRPASSTLIPRGTAMLVMLVTAAVLIGWCFEIDTFKRLIPGAVSMNPLTALTLFAAAIALRMLVNHQQPRCLSPPGFSR